MKTTSVHESERTVILVDGDVIAYRAAAATQQYVEWKPDQVSAWCDVSTAINLSANEIEEAAVNLEADEIVVCLSDPEDNFRVDVLPTYKGHRAAVMKPTGLYNVKRWMENNYKAITRPRLEADDLLGIIATSGDKIIAGRKIIVTRDKDLRTIPAEVYFLGDRGGRVRAHTFTKEQADKFWLLQTLMGDVTDGYKGCPAIGSVKAAKLIDAAGSTFAEWWDCVVSAYEAAGQSVEDAITMAQVARILRAEDYDWETGKVDLWTPARLSAASTADTSAGTTASAPTSRGRKPKSKKLVRHLKGIRAMTRLRSRVFGRM